MFFAIAALLSRPPLGRLYDKYGNIIMYPAFLCFAAGMFVLGMANSPTALFVSGALLGCGDGTFCSLGRAIAVQGMPTYKYGLATSTFLAISEVGTGLGPFFLGMIIPFSGYRNLYHLMGMVALLAMGCFYWQYHNRKF
jgi:predicted MFS family arabinose efflux permease